MSLSRNLARYLARDPGQLQLTSSKPKHFSDTAGGSYVKSSLTGPQLKHYSIKSTMGYTIIMPCRL